MCYTFSHMANIDEKLDELAQMVARGFAATATKEDVEEIRTDVAELRDAIPLMIDKALGLVRRDYDSLATRMKDLEQATN